MAKGAGRRRSDLGMLAEIDTRRGVTSKYRLGADGALVRQQRGSRGLLQLAQDTFLPRDWQHSVAPEYLTYQAWDTLQALCSYLRGILATKSLLEGAGVGSAEATPLSAAINWVLRDGAGMLGGLVFGYAASPSFDANVKFWRLFADVINDVALTLDMLAPLLSADHFLPVLCVSSVCKAMCGVSAGASKAALSGHFARRDNMADVAAKESAQETAVSLLGLVLGIYFAKAVNHSPPLIWAMFAVLTAVHVLANYRAVRSICLPTLNRQRTRIALRRFGAGEELSPQAVASEENVWLRNPDPQRIRIGASVGEAVKTAAEAEGVLAALLLSSVFSPTPRVTLLREDATAVDELQAYVSSVSPQSSAEDFGAFVEALQKAGWRTDRVMLGVEPWRVTIK